MTTKIIRPFLALFLALFTFLQANVQDKTSQRIQIQAQNIFSENNKTTAFGNLLFRGYDYNVTADKVEFENNMSSIEFFENIRIVNKAEANGSIELTGEYLKIIVQDNEFALKNFHFQDEQNDIYIKTECATKKAAIFELNNTIYSSCTDIDNAFWSIQFSEGKYDSINQTFVLKNAKFYIKKMPVLYLPFITLQGGKKQKSGFLAPKLSIFGEQAYMQSIFFVLRENIDVDITPYVRSKSGYGLYSYLRFMDSNSSQGQIKLGYFQNFENSTIIREPFYGYNFDYINKFVDQENKQVFFKTSLQNYNNLAYLQFQKINNLDLIINETTDSTINYVYQQNDWQFNTSVKNRKNNNSGKEVEILPLFEATKAKSFLSKNISYDVSYKLQNERRLAEESLSPVYQEALLPVYYRSSFFGDYLSLDVKNEIKYIRQDFFRRRDGQTQLATQSDSLQDYLQVGVSSNLVKFYQNIFHNIDMSVYSKNLIKTIANEAYTIPEGDKDKIGISVEQYFLNNGDNLLSHSYEQEIIKNDEGEFDNLGLITNYFQYQTKVIQFYNKNSYSLPESKILYSSTSVGIKANVFNLSFSHLQEDKKEEQVSYYTAGMEGLFASKVKLGFDVEFDAFSKETKKWISSVQILHDCWNYKLKFGENHTPQIASSGEAGNSVVYFELNFVPIGGVSHSYYF